MTNLDSVLKSRDITLLTKIHIDKAYGLPSAHTQLWELDHKEGRRPKNWCLRTVVLEKTPESPLDSKETKPVNLKGEQPWIFTGRTDAEAEPSVFWSSKANRQLTGKLPDAAKDWGQKKVLENEMAGWHHRCNEHELGQIPEGGEGQGGLACCSPWGHDWATERPQAERTIKCNMISWIRAWNRKRVLVKKLVKCE